MITTKDIRQSFIDYFKAQDHTVVPSSSLVPDNDPTLLFTNAGMNQFKNIFTGVTPHPYPRAVSSQKCVRAGGKHNDLENVGYTARHHTFFEMLGNFSFGDYFKEKAILHAWEYLTKTLELPPEKLLVTVYHEDEEARALWKKISGFGDKKIISIATSDNFWAMGDTGPCGPCSEIFYDHGEHIPGGPPGSPDEDGDRFIEIWNLVFMSFNQLDGETREPLPAPSIDTGMGLERLTTVLQGKHDNYDIDLFQNLIGSAEEIFKLKAEGDQRFSFRVLADHIRACSFLISDGVSPSNEGRGYVLRRIMRRAMRHCHILGARTPKFYQLVPSLVHEMGDFFPQLSERQVLIEETLKLEEERFQKTLSTGLQLLEKATTSLASSMLPGETAFQLYDTYGFPLDLTQDILKSQNITVDEAGFQKAMEAQKARARASWKGGSHSGQEKFWFEILDQVGPTEFMGYDNLKAESIVRSLSREGKSLQDIKPNENFDLVLSQTPFYGESGGQVGDTGTITTAEGFKAQVNHVSKQAEGHLFVHHCTALEDTLIPDTQVHLEVDREHRRATARNHSATHLLHKALQKHLGEAVVQRGSLVTPDRLRFDFSWPKALTYDELQAVTEEVNTQILENAAVTTHLMSPEDAKAKGAMALFGEKYGDIVRVVSMGTPDTEGKETYSVELCGGTHVCRTGDIGSFVILHESAVAAGIRRIEAITGNAVLTAYQQQQTLLQSLSSTLKVGLSGLSEKAEKLLEERKSLEKQLQDLRKAGGGGTGKSQEEALKGFTLKTKLLQDVAPGELRGIVDQLLRESTHTVAVVGTSFQNKGALVVGVSPDLTNRFNAINLVKIGATALGGKGGGGRPDMAQAGGPEGDALEKAFQDIRQELVG